MNIIQEYVQLVLQESLPVVKFTDFDKVLKHLGYVPDRQNGSHVAYVPTKPGMPSIPTVKKEREISKGTLRNIIRAMGLTDKDLAALLRSV